MQAPRFWWEKPGAMAAFKLNLVGYKGKELMVDASKECRIYLMDTDSIGGDDHRTPLYRTPLICNEDVNFASAGIWGSLASWEDAKGTRWVLTPIMPLP